MIHKEATMNPAGLGTQILECLRVRQLLERHAEVFLGRVFTPAEQAFCGQRVRSVEYYTASWAAKEAVLRSLGITWHRGIPWTDIELTFGSDSPMSPRVEVSGIVADVAHAKQVTSWLISMAHCRAYGTATAIALRG
jgi:holo-[acyl-carrier protein] synthase